MEVKEAEINGKMAPTIGNMMGITTQEYAGPDYPGSNRAEGFFDGVWNECLLIADESSCPMEEIIDFIGYEQWRYDKIQKINGLIS